MDSQVTSSPVFDDQDTNDYVTKLHHFGFQRVMNDANDASNARNENLANSIRQSKAWNRDYLNAKMATQMDELRTMIASRKSSSSSTS